MNYLNSVSKCIACLSLAAAAVAAGASDIEVNPSLRNSDEYKEIRKTGSSARVIRQTVQVGTDGSQEIVSEDIDGKAVVRPKTRLPPVSAAPAATATREIDPRCATQEGLLRLGSLCNK